METDGKMSGSDLEEFMKIAVSLIGIGIITVAIYFLRKPR